MGNGVVAEARTIGGRQAGPPRGEPHLDEAEGTVPMVELVGDTSPGGRNIPSLQVQCTRYALVRMEERHEWFYSNNSYGKIQQ